MSDAVVMTEAEKKKVHEALRAMVLCQPIPTPDAALFDEFIRRYPEHALEFAIELAIDTVLHAYLRAIRG